jgi:hypothetical protein
MKIQGIIKGNTIELLEDLSLPNGVKISRSIPDNLIQKKLLWEEKLLLEYGKINQNSQRQ